MRFLTPTLAVSALLCAAHASPYPACGNERGPGKAAYFLNNDPVGNTIVSLRMSRNGTLSNPIQTSTGGHGQLAVPVASFFEGFDTLFSQGSVVVSGDLLFTVNPGSNTVSMFRIPYDDPQHPQLVGELAPTLGDFPMSITYSSALGTACVLNGGASSSVTCFQVDPCYGLTSLDTRSLNGAIRQTTPPSGPPGTASQVLFTPRSDAVIAIVKGNASATPPTPGFFYTFPVTDGEVATEPVITRIPDIPMNFGSVFLSDSRFLMTDPSYGASILDLSTSSFNISEDKHISVANQTLSCWAVYAPELRTAYVIDAKLSSIPAIDATNGNIRGYITFESSALGGADTALYKTRMYILAGAGEAAVIVIDLKKGEYGAQQQILDLSSLGSRTGWMGMAIY